MVVMRRMVMSMLAIIIVSSTAVVMAPSTTFAQSACDKKGTIITLKPWYYGLTEQVGGKCQIKSPGSTAAEQQKFTTRIILTVIEDLLQIAAYVTVAFIIMGGFKYMTSSGSPDQAAKAMKTIINAVIGMVVALGSVGLVNFVGKYLGL